MVVENWEGVYSQKMVKRYDRITHVLVSVYLVTKSFLNIIKGGRLWEKTTGSLEIPAPVAEEKN